MKPKPLLITLAAVSALAANAAQVVVTTGASYVKMVDALAALYQKETGVAVETSFGGNIGQMLAPVKHGSGVNVVISDEASLEKFHDALAPDARRLGDTPLVLVWRKGLAPRVLDFVITIPLVFPPVALGYMLLTALGRTSLVGGALEPFGLSLIFNETAVALAGFIAGLPLVVRPLQAAFASPRLIELEEAVRIHGASRRDVFLRVTLPLVRPSLAAALLLGCAASRARWTSP